MTQVKTFNRRTFLKTGVIGAGAVALATAVKNAIIAYVIECEKNHKHPTIGECATCLSTFIETENKDYESDFLFGISKPSVGGVDRITMDSISNVGKKLTGEREIQKGFRPGETDRGGTYEHHITNKAK